VDLVDGVPVAAQEPGQANAVGPGAFDTERKDSPVRADVTKTELEEFDEAGRRGRDEQFGQSAAESVDQNSDVLVLVGVDADDDIVAP
jgi:hypothetical protein